MAADVGCSMLGNSSVFGLITGYAGILKREYSEEENSGKKEKGRKL